MHLREATAGFEPAIGVLQTPALPLGYVAVPIIVAYQATAEMSNRLPGRGLLHDGGKFLAAIHIWSKRPLRTAARIGGRFSSSLRDQCMPGRRSRLCIAWHRFRTCRCRWAILSRAFRCSSSHERVEDVLTVDGAAKGIARVPEVCIDWGRVDFREEQLGSPWRDKRSAVGGAGIS